MKSMTGCGKGTAENEQYAVTVELKSVNHRYLDLSLRMPRAYADLEDPIRRRITGCLRRGHVEASAVIVQKKDASVCLRVDQALAAAYLQPGQGPVR